MSNEKRFDPKSVAKLDAPDRAECFPVNAILDAAGACGMLNVADIGAGSGYFAIPAAKRVAPGKVFAVEPSAELREVLSGRLADDGGAPNVLIVNGEASATQLPEASCDLILLSAVWHEIDDHAAALREFSRIAAPNAKLAIIDWRPDATRPPGPPLEIRIPRSQVETTLEDNGWGVVKSDEVTPATYIVVAQR